MECMAAIYVEVLNEETACRLLFYLDEDARPDFPEDVADEEAPLVEAFEFVPAPVESVVEGNTVSIYIEPDDFEETEELVKAVGLFQPEKLYLFFCDDEETRHYYRYQNSQLDLIFSEIPLDDPVDDEMHNRRLPEELVQRIIDMEDKSQALALLAKESYRIS